MREIQREQSRFVLIQQGNDMQLSACTHPHNPQITNISSMLPTSLPSTVWAFEPLMHTLWITSKDVLQRSLKQTDS
jgi:hypothetical protein